MAKVKFVQIGNATLSKTEYQEKLTAALTDYPGAIIFGTYYDSEKVKSVQEIWANGTQYSVGAGSDAKFYTGEDAPETYFGPTGEGKDVHPQHGDYYIQTKDLNPQDPNFTADDAKFRKAFCYDSLIKEGETTVGGWVALVGNYDAKNIFFPNGIKRNQPWGWKTQVEPTSKRECVGYSLDSVMKYYLLVSGAVTDPTNAENVATDPTMDVTSSDSVSFTVYDKPSSDTSGEGGKYGGTAQTSGTWYMVGTKLYIIKGSDVEFTGYNLSTNVPGVTEDLSTGIKSKSITEGGATVTTSQYGYWNDSKYAAEGSTDHIAKDGSGNVLTTKTGSSTTATFTLNKTQTDGTVSLTLSSSNITYTAPSGEDDTESTTTPSSQTSLNLKNATYDRIFTVEEGESGTITLTGTNGNTWSGVRSAFTIPAVPTIYAANNEYDKSKTWTYTPTAHSAKTIKSTAIGNTVKTFIAKGYYPVYSNIDMTTWTGTSASLSMINNTDKDDYSWSKSTKWSSADEKERPVVIEYPSAKTLTIKVGGNAAAVITTSTTRTIAGNSVAYKRCVVRNAYAAGQTVVFSLS